MRTSLCILCSLTLLHLLPQADPAARIAAFSVLVERSVAAADDLAYLPLPQLAVTFVATQLKVWLQEVFVDGIT